MRGGRCRPTLRSFVLASCAAVAVAAWTMRARGEEPVGQHSGAVPPAPLAFELRLGKALPDWLLEDDLGQRFDLSETRGRPLVLAFGLALVGWDQGVRALRAVVEHRAAVLHLVGVPSVQADDAADAPLIPARDMVQQHREDAAWLAGVGEGPGRSVRRLPRGPGDGPRWWRFGGRQPMVLIVSDADGVVRQEIVRRDMTAQGRVHWDVLLDATIACAGGGPPVSEDGRALVASGLLRACASPDRTSERR